MSDQKQPGHVLSADETRRILDRIPRLGLAEPVVIVDRRAERPDEAVVIERQRLLEMLTPDEPCEAALIRLLDPCAWPFVRVIVTELDGSTYALRICRPLPTGAKGVRGVA